MSTANWMWVCRREFVFTTVLGPILKLLYRTQRKIRNKAAKFIIYHIQSDHKKLILVTMNLSHKNFIS
jgi:F420-0:gamma-glutamyl ligase-like protein